MSWVDIENVMQSAIVRASGLASDRVFWSYQDVNEPQLDHITIRFGGEIVIGIDRVETTTNLSRPRGQEIKQEIKGVREVPFEIEVFTAATSGDAAARRVAELVRTRLRLPDIRYALRGVGVSPFDPGPISYVPDVPSAKFRGRAICTIRCYVPVMDCIEYTGYIARVRGNVYIHGMVGASSPTGTAIPFDSANG